MARLSDWRISDSGTGHLERSRFVLASGLWTDVSFIVGKEEQEFKAHKLILRIGSRVFDELFDQNRDSDIFEVPDLEPFQFSSLLQFLYKGESPKNSEAALRLLDAASKFQVGNLVRICWDLLEKALNKDTALPIFRHALKYGHAGLEERAIKQICRNGYRIINSSQFLDLSINELRQISARDDLILYTEMQLFDALINWARAECKRQKCLETNKYLRSVLETVIHLVRFPQMHPSDFGLKVVPTNVLLTEEVMSVLVYFNVKQAHRSSIPAGFFNSKPRVQYVPQGEELVLQRLYRDEYASVMDLSTNKHLNINYIPTSTNEHSIRLKSSMSIWLSSIGINSANKMMTPDISSMTRKQRQRCDNSITVQIQLKDDERKVLATKIAVIDDTRELTDTEGVIWFNSPVFLRPGDWYILSFTVTSGIFYADQFTPADEVGRVIYFDLMHDGIKFEFDNDENMKYTGVTQGCIPSIGFMIE